MFVFPFKMCFPCINTWKRATGCIKGYIKGYIKQNLMYILNQFMLVYGHTKDLI